jgi:hypothetical protein
MDQEREKAIGSIEFLRSAAHAPELKAKTGLKSA